MFSWFIMFIQANLPILTLDRIFIRKSVIVCFPLWSSAAATRKKGTTRVIVIILPSSYPTSKHKIFPTKTFCLPINFPTEDDQDEGGGDGGDDGEWICTH